MRKARILTAVERESILAKSGEYDFIAFSEETWTRPRLMIVDVEDYSAAVSEILAANTSGTATRIRIVSHVSMPQATLTFSCKRSASH